MPCDLDHARRAFDRMSEAVQKLERRQPVAPEEAPRYEAELHLARLRAYVAQGRVLALEDSYHAHKATESFPMRA
ncbi:hypothetical protein OPKNFCMD_5242 [Methylobacterium crusticola]|uniref:Uncharacterized protein n=1 Tax=Methylobacterium crusticola TaxID=1697972 RepID=A0ABQ4R6N5_9HYPH|nr:hypothetical protein [Methylobacterium crusticola]GJD52476.1 hypothetical protein OPKNFCMD_5242 [Methylobacterium crusticola]